jgi:hypothetical protein
MDKNISAYCGYSDSDRLASEAAGRAHCRCIGIAPQATTYRAAKSIGRADPANACRDRAADDATHQSRGDWITKGSDVTSDFKKVWCAYITLLRTHVLARATLLRRKL